MTDIYANTAPAVLTASLPAAGVPGGLISRTYPYLFSHGIPITSSAFWNGESYLAYAFQYQNYSTGTYPLAVPAVNKEAALYAWGPGSLDTINTPTSKYALTAFGSATLFAADLGHGLLLLEALGLASYSPTNASSFYQKVYRGKTYLAHAEDLLHWLVQPATVGYGASDTYSTNRVLRYASAYLLLGKALANLGDVTDGCAAIGIGANYLERAIILGNGCLTSIYETFPEFENNCPAFDSNYQAVSVMYLNWLYMNMPTSGIRSATYGTTITTADVFVPAIHGMNKEFAETQLIVNGAARNPTNGWCYPVSGTFGDGEISECGNSRIGGGKCGTGEFFDAISATTAFQEFGQLVNQTAPGNVASINYADQTSRWYTTGFKTGVIDNCTLDPYQPFYL